MNTRALQSRKRKAVKYKKSLDYCLMYVTIPFMSLGLGARARLRATENPARWNHKAVTQRNVTFVTE